MAASSSAAAANSPSAAEATRGRSSERDTTSSSGRMSETGWFGIDLAHDAGHRPAERLGFAAGGADDEGERADRELRERQVDGRPELAVEAGQRDVADDADDLLGLAERIGQPAPDRRDVGREQADERLVDDGHARPAVDIGVGEVAALRAAGSAAWRSSRA